MRIQCTITGRNLKADGNIFPSVLVRHSHPIFSLPLKQLARMAQVEHINKEEKQLLFLALCLQLDTVNIAGQVPIPFPADWQDLPDLYTSTLLDLIPYVNRHGTCAGFPMFAICADNLGALPAYFAILQDFRQYRKHSPKVLAGDSIDIEERLETAKQLARAAAIRKQQDKLTLASVIQWAIEQLALSEIRSKLLRQALSKSGISIDIIQDLLGDCLDRLPEYREHDAIKKQWLIDRLNAAMVEKLHLLQSMGIDITDSTDYLNAIHATYTIQHDGQALPNAATETGKALAELPAASPTAPVPYLRPASEPTPEQFPNKLAYMAALRKYQQGS